MVDPPIKQRIVASIFSKVPPTILEELTGRGPIIVYYHMVSDDAVPHVDHLYGYKNVGQFSEDLDFLLENFSPVSLHDMLDHLMNGSPLPAKPLLLTFDDGFREMHDVVAPLLVEKGIPATFFLSSAFIDNASLCYQHKASILAGRLVGGVSPDLRERIRELLLIGTRAFDDISSGILSIRYRDSALLDEIALMLNVDFDDYLVRNKPYLTTVQILGLIDGGFTIGAHSIDHPRYSILSLEDQLYQTLESVKVIRERFHLDYGAFAFPHSDHDVSKTFFTEVYGSGLVDVSFGTGGMMDDSFPNNFQRISLEKPLLDARRVIALHRARKLKRYVTGGMKVQRKQ